MYKQFGRHPPGGRRGPWVAERGGVSGTRTGCMDPATLSYLSIGSLGTGFGEESLERGLAMGVDFIGADAGSVDGGPQALAGGPPAWSDASYRRDLSLLLRASRRAGVPLLVGSCAISGRDWGVDYFADIAR